MTLNGAMVGNSEFIYVSYFLVLTFKVSLILVKKFIFLQIKRSTYLPEDTWMAKSHSRRFTLGTRVIS